MPFRSCLVGTLDCVQRTANHSVVIVVFGDGQLVHGLAPFFANWIISTLTFIQDTSFAGEVFRLEWR